MIAPRRPDPPVAWSRLATFAEKFAEAAGDLDPAQLRRLAASFTPRQLERALESLSVVAMASGEFAEVLERVHRRREERGTAPVRRRA